MFCLFFVTLGINEIARALFSTRKISRWLFFTISLLSLIGMHLNFGLPPWLIFALGFSVLSFGLLILHRKDSSPDKLFSALSCGSLGLLYCLLCSFAAIQILTLQSGVEWFLLFLVVVFAGDTSAYFGGISFGKTKLIEQISPKKTVTGSLFGLAGSGLIGLAFGFFLFQDFWPIVGLASVIGGVFAQTGDLLMSLIKRVSAVKDSGKLLPGHGGVLDRIDGVLLAAPWFYFVAFSLELSSRAQ